MKTPKPPVKSIFWLSLIVALLILAAYCLVYLLQPFRAILNPAIEFTLNDLLLNLLVILCAVLSASASTAILAQHQRDEPPFLIWLNFTVGLWFWTLAEVIWMVFNLTLGEVPDVTIADVLWVLGYYLFGLCLLQQYSLVYRIKARHAWSGYIVVALVVLAISTGIATILQIRQGVNLLSGIVNYYYVVSDIGIGLFALVLMVNFRGGVMIRPWLGLFVMAMSDALYAWLYLSDTYSYMSWMGNIPTLIADLAYLMAYLVLTIGFLMHYLLLKFGPPALRGKQV